MEVPESLIDGGGDKKDDSGGRELSKPVEAQATMALEMGPVAEMRSRAERVDSKSAGGDDATQLIDVSSIRSGQTSPESPESSDRRSGQKVERRPGPASSGPSLLDDSRAVPFPFSRLERLAGEECRALNALVSVLPPTTKIEDVARSVARRLEEVVGCPHRVRWGGAGMALASGSAVELDDGVWTWGRMPPGHDRFVVGAQRRLADAWVEAIEADGPGVLGGDFVSGMVTYVLAELFEAFCQQVGWPGLCWAVNPMGERDLKTMLLSGGSMLLEMTFVVECEGRRGVVRWWLPNGVLRRLAVPVTEAVNWSEEASRAWWGGLALKRPVVAGTVTVRDEELERMRIGDVLLVGRHGVEVDGVEQSAVEGGARWRFAAAKAVRGRLMTGEEGFWRFEVDARQLVTTTEEVDVSEQRHDESEDGGVAVQRAKMEVEVRLGTMEMELAELARIRPGQVLDCDTPLGSSVELVVSGAPVGKGELVGVDGQLGVRILSMTAP